MDNRVFNINGSGLPQLEAVLQLAFNQWSYRSNPTVDGYVVNEDKGLILLWALGEEKANKFITPLTAKEVAPLVFAWLNSEEAKTIKLNNWDRDISHDGSNSSGWRVYCEDWGHVSGYRNSLVAITPAYMWHGK